MNESKTAKRYLEVKSIISEHSEKVIDDFYNKIKKLILKNGIEEPEQIVKKIFSGKSKIISSTIFTLFQHNVKINIRFIKKDKSIEDPSQSFLAYYDSIKNKKFVYVEIFINNIAENIDSEKTLGQSLLDNEEQIKLNTYSLIYHEISHILNIDEDFSEISKVNLDNFKKQYSHEIKNLPERESSDLEYIFKEDEREARVFQYIAYIEKFISTNKIEPAYDNAVSILDDVIVYKSDTIDRSFYDKLLETIKHTYK